MIDLRVRKVRMAIKVYGSLLSKSWTIQNFYYSRRLKISSQVFSRKYVTLFLTVILSQWWKLWWNYMKYSTYTLTIVFDKDEKLQYQSLLVTGKKSANQLATVIIQERDIVWSVMTRILMYLHWTRKNWYRTEINRPWSMRKYEAIAQFNNCAIWNDPISGRKI